MVETIENIVAEMREMERHTVGGIVPVNPKKLADRIEAAVKRNICKCGRYSAQRMLTIVSKGGSYCYGFKNTEDADMVLDILSKCTEQEIEKHSDEWKTIGDRIDYSETPF